MPEIFEIDESLIFELDNWDYLEPLILSEVLNSLDH